MRAFVVRPFGVKQGIDFDAVDRELIAPVLARLSMVGATSADIVQYGNMRSDMFQLLITADVVIADVSIHNAGVFYALGIRHALRPGCSVLIRANVDAFAFDLPSDRYLV